MLHLPIQVALLFLRYLIDNPYQHLEPEIFGKLLDQQPTAPPKLLLNSMLRDNL